MHVSDELLTLISEYVTEHRPAGLADRWLFEGDSGNPPRQNTVGY